jgi:hypothetical protein
MKSSTNGRKLLLGVATAAVLCAGTAIAGDIYRYTDDDGNVVYVDRPTDAPGGERVNIVSRSTDNAAIQARAKARTEANTTTAEERRQARLDEQKAREAEESAQQERDDRCQIARNRMETLVTSRRLFREDSSGERVYLDETQIQEARDRVQAQIEESCD